MVQYWKIGSAHVYPDVFWSVLLGGSEAHDVHVVDATRALREFDEDGGVARRVVGTWWSLTAWHRWAGLQMTYSPTTERIKVQSSLVAPSVLLIASMSPGDIHATALASAGKFPLEMSLDLTLQGGAKPQSKDLEDILKNKDHKLALVLSEATIGGIQYVELIVASGRGKPEEGTRCTHICDGLVVAGRRGWYPLAYTVLRGAPQISFCERHAKHANRYASLPGAVKVAVRPWYVDRATGLLFRS